MLIFKHNLRTLKEISHFNNLYTICRIVRLLTRFSLVSEHAHRFILIPTLDEENFKSLIRQSTLLLDPFPFGGGVTSLEAFDLCKTVISLPSYQSVPTLTGGMIEVMGITNFLAANTIDEYVKIVGHLIQNEKYRREVESTICSKNYLLYDQKSVVKEWETLFFRLVKKD